MSEKRKSPKRASAKKQPKTTSTASKKQEESGTSPLMSYEALGTAGYSSTRSRRNLSSVIDRTDKYRNIDDGLVPFIYSSPSATGSASSSIEIRDAVILCQKAYYNFAQFRNVIDLMTEFAIGDLYFNGGNRKSRSFFEQFFKKIDLHSLQDKFYREFFRSGNVFMYRFEGKLDDRDSKRIAEVFGAENVLGDEARLPIRYVMLNPADIRLTGTASFYRGNYVKMLSAYEIQRIRSPLTEEDETLRDSLSPEVIKEIDSGRKRNISMPLDPSRLISIFYKKQDYEPFAVPMGFPVLGDLNFKSELKKMDMAMGRCMQQAILLVTMGTDPEKGGINQKNLVAMQKLFENESVGRVLIADYTTKAQFVVPGVAELMSPTKYEIFDRDINMGLNNILVGGEKFANQNAKTEVFIARLESARQTFLQSFLIPEMKRVSKKLGFRSTPEPLLAEMSLTDDNVKDRIFTRLYELGVLTPEEVLEAIDSKRLPEIKNSRESQKDFLKEKQEGLYEPIMSKDPLGGPPAPNEEGRPAGTKAPQETKNVSPIGQGEQSKFTKASESPLKYSLANLKDNMILSQRLNSEVISHLKKMHKVKRITQKQKQVAEAICDLIIINESPSEWINCVSKYCEEPMDHNLDRVKKVQDIAYENNLDTYLASLLLGSIKETD